MSPDDSLHAAIERITAGLRAELEREVSSAIDGLKRRAAEDRERAAREAAEVAAAAVRREAAGQIADARDAAQREVESLKRAVLEEREKAAQLAAENAAAEMRRQAEVQAQVGRVQEAARLRIEELQRTSAEERQRAVQQATEAAAAEVRREADIQIAQLRENANRHVEEIRRSAEAQISELRATLQAQLDEVTRRARSEVEQVKAQLERARADNEAVARAARAEAEEVVIAQLTAAQAETEKKVQAAVEQTRTDAQQTELAYTARLLDGIRRLDDTRSLGETLDALAECAARHVERAAVLVVKGNRLQIRRLCGFSGAAPAADLDLEAAGLAGSAVTAAATVTRAAIDAHNPQSNGQAAIPTFAQEGGMPRYALALPIAVGGRIVAVLYADSTKPDAAASRWPATMEVLARHASRMLEALTVQRAAGLSLPRPVPRMPRSPVPGPLEHGGSGDEDAARRYARLLVSEIRMYHEPMVDAGRRSRDLRTRLGGEIDRARRLYEERVPQTVRERSDYFEQELVRTLADGDRSLLG